MEKTFEKTIDKSENPSIIVSVKGKGNTPSTDRGWKKSQRNFKKVLDKLPNLWYNKDVPKRNTKSREGKPY